MVLQLGGCGRVSDCRNNLLRGKPCPFVDGAFLLFTRICYLPAAHLPGAGLLGPRQVANRDWPRSIVGSGGAIPVFIVVVWGYPEEPGSLRRRDLTGRIEPAAARFWPWNLDRLSM